MTRAALIPRILTLTAGLLAPALAAAQERIEVTVRGAADKPFQVALPRFASDGRNGELFDLTGNQPHYWSAATGSACATASGT